MSKKMNSAIPLASTEHFRTLHSLFFGTFLIDLCNLFITCGRQLNYLPSTKHKEK